MNAFSFKKLLNLVFLTFLGLLGAFYLSAQCDSIKLDFSFSYLSGDTVLLINQSDGFDFYEWSIEGGQALEEFDQSLFLLQHSDSLVVCLSGRLIDGCERITCKQLFAGHQDDLCLQTDCIWPGDANGDQRANQYDLLNIGLGFGETGPPRSVFPIPEDPIFWAPSFNMDWEQAIGAVNYKHFDCDGNGIINEQDILAIQKNYTPASQRPNTPTNGAPLVNLDLESSIEYQGNDPAVVTITADLKIGTLQLPIEDLHGMAFRLRFPDQPFNITSIQANLEEPDLLGSTQDLLTVSKRINKGEKQDFFDLGVTKKNTFGSTGFGRAVSIRIISADIIELLNAPATPFKVAIEGLLLIDSNGDTLQYDIAVDTACVNFVENVTSSKEERLPQTALQIMPNPSTDYVIVRTLQQLQLQQYKLMNASGQVISLGQFRGNTQERIDLHAQRPGWYFLKILTDQGVLTKKILKIK